MLISSSAYLEAAADCRLGVDYHQALGRVTLTVSPLAPPWRVAQLRYIVEHEASPLHVATVRRAWPFERLARRVHRRLRRGRLGVRR